MSTSLPAAIIAATVACGACVDQSFIGVAPFLIPWLIVFVFWSLLIGPLVFRYTHRGTTPDLHNPARLFLGFFLLLIGSVLILMGSLLLPFLFLAPFWISALIGGLRRGSTGWKRFCQFTLAAMLVAIPVSYVVLGAKGAPARHAPRPALPGSLPLAPAKPAPSPSTPTTATPTPVEALPPTIPPAAAPAP